MDDDAVLAMHPLRLLVVATVCVLASAPVVSHADLLQQSTRPAVCAPHAYALPPSEELIGEPLSEALQLLARRWTGSDDFRVLFGKNSDRPQIQYGLRNREPRNTFTKYDPTYADHFVIRTSPHSDAAICVYGGAVIWLEIASCKRFEMPNLIGKTQADAEAKLGDECKHLKETEIRTVAVAPTEEYAGRAIGEVVGQWPRVGERLESGYQPLLLVKRDPTIQPQPAVYLPDIEGKLLADARLMLQAERSVPDLEAFDLLRGGVVAGDEQRTVKKQWPAPTQALYPLEQKPLVILEPTGPITCDREGNCAEEEDDSTAPALVAGAGALATLVLLRVLQAVRGGGASSGRPGPPPLPVSGGAAPPALRVRPERPNQGKERPGDQAKAGPGGTPPLPSPEELVIQPLRLPTYTPVPEKV